MKRDHARATLGPTPGTQEVLNKECSLLDTLIIFTNEETKAQDGEVLQLEVAEPDSVSGETHSRAQVLQLAKPQFVLTEFRGRIGHSRGLPTAVTCMCSLPSVPSRQCVLCQVK